MDQVAFLQLGSTKTSSGSPGATHRKSHSTPGSLAAAFFTPTCGSLCHRAGQKTIRQEPCFPLHSETTHQTGVHTCLPCLRRISTDCCPTKGSPTGLEKVHRQSYPNPQKPRSALRGTCPGALAPGRFHRFLRCFCHNRYGRQYYRWSGRKPAWLRRDG